MAGVQAIADLIGELEAQLVVCMRCGMCQAVCPLYRETGREADVARGKLALLDGLLHRLLEDPQGVLDRLNKCLLCGSCAAACPSGVSALEIFIKARAILTGYMGLSPAKKAILRGLLKRPGLFDRLVEWGAAFQAVFTRPVNEVLGTSCARISSPLIGDRHFVKPAKQPFHRRLPFRDTPAGPSGLRVGYFVGCLVDKLFPTIAQAAVDVLSHHGVGIWMPRGQGCCGIPAVSAGDLETFRHLVRHHVDLFFQQEFDYLVTACATCTSTIKKVWPMMVDGADAQLSRQVRTLAERTLDISAFLVSRVALEKGPPAPGRPPIDVTYHDPCHLKKSLGVAAEPRTLIGAHPGYRLVEMATPDWCCGMGGSFNLQHYDISATIGQRKYEQIRATGCQVVATGCPACMVQISDVLSRNNERLAVRHPIEIYAEGLGLR